MSDLERESWPKIPGYELLAVAGRGGMGIVYRGREVGTGREVAIKMLSGEPAEHRLHRFELEAQIVASLEHPHIVPIYHFGRLHEQPYMVTRYLEGGTVADRLVAEAIPLSQSLNWVMAIADAVDVAHGRGIVHRDIKPGNMLLDGRDNVYLTDFGLAGVFDRNSLALAGSAAYMSPEQCRGEEKLTPAADVYTLAVTLFELVTGKKPFIADSPLAVLVKHIEQPPPSARSLNGEVSPALDDVIQWGMAKEPADRPPTGAAFLRALLIAQAEPEQPVRLPRIFPLADESEFFRPPALIEPAAGRSEQRPGSGWSRSIWLWGALFLIVALAIWVGLTGDSQSPPVPTLPSSPTRPAAILPTAPATPIGQLYADDFGETSTAEDAQDEARLFEEQLELSTEDRRFRIFWAAEMAERAETRTELEVRPAVLPPRFELGILCRFQDPETFWGGIWLIDDQPRQELWRVSGGEIEILAQSPLSADQIGRLKEPFKAALICSSDTLELAVDGESWLVADPGDLPANPPAGRAAVMIRPLVGERQTILFDNLRVWER